MDDESRRARSLMKAIKIAEDTVSSIEPEYVRQLRGPKPAEYTKRKPPAIDFKSSYRLKPWQRSMEDVVVDRIIPPALPPSGIAFEMSREPHARDARRMDIKMSQAREKREREKAEYQAFLDSKEFKDYSVFDSDDEKNKGEATTGEKRPLSADPPDGQTKSEHSKSCTHDVCVCGESPAEDGEPTQELKSPAPRSEDKDLSTSTPVPISAPESDMRAEGDQVSDMTSAEPTEETPEEIPLPSIESAPVLAVKPKRKRPQLRNLSLSDEFTTGPFVARRKKWETAECKMADNETWSQFAARRFDSVLTWHEKEEIVGYGNGVYFLGEKAKKFQPDKLRSDCGFDDSNGSYQAIRVKDHIKYRYEVLGFLGRGAYGTVVKCYDHVTGDTVAIKICRKDKKIEKALLDEILILKYLQDNDIAGDKYTVRLHGNFMFRHHICMVFELLSSNLYEALSRTSFNGMSQRCVRRLTKNILDAIHFMHRMKISHCDLKPENIALKQEASSEIRVIDFGISCFEGCEKLAYLQSRFYRAPEVMLGFKYGNKIDMWSVGCIVGELVNGQPLFPGEDEYEMMALQMECCGLPPKKMMYSTPFRKSYYREDYTPDYCRVVDANGTLVGEVLSDQYVGPPGSRPLSSFMKLNSAVFIDFLTNLLHFDPRQRLSAAEALRHPWITGKVCRPKTVKRATPLGRPSNGTVLPRIIPLKSKHIDLHSEDGIPKTGVNGFTYVPKVPFHPALKTTMATSTATTATTKKKKDVQGDKQHKQKSVTDQKTSLPRIERIERKWTDR